MPSFTAATRRWQQDREARELRYLRTCQQRRERAARAADARVGYLEALARSRPSVLTEGDIRVIMERRVNRWLDKKLRHSAA